MAINGSLVDYFEGMKVLRQGHPLYPFLFVIAIEVLSRLLDEAAVDMAMFEIHHRCSKLNLHHLP